MSNLAVSIIFFRFQAFFFRAHLELFQAFLMLRLLRRFHFLLAPYRSHSLSTLHSFIISDQYTFFLWHPFTEDVFLFSLLIVPSLSISSHLFNRWTYLVSTLSLPFQLVDLERSLYERSIVRFPRLFPLYLLFLPLVEL